MCAPKNLYIFERSIKSSLNVFASLNCTANELGRLTEMCNVMGRDKLYPNTKCFYIYVSTSTQNCLEHINKRKKTTDGYITLDYLEMLEKKHHEVFVCTETPEMFVVDGNTTEDKLAQNVARIICKIHKNYKH